MPVIYMDRASAESLTEKDIREIIDENLMDLKYGMLTDYYVGSTEFFQRPRKIVQHRTTVWLITWRSTSRIRQPVICWAAGCL